MFPGSTFSLRTPEAFNFERTVCSYGYFLLAPNRWDPQTGVFQRVLLLADDQPTTVTLWPSTSGRSLNVAADVALNHQKKTAIRRKVVRMLRLEPSPDYAHFHRLHAAAKRRGFARMFRSPTFFEDIVKTITTCNVTWPNTMRMNRLLCEHAGGGAFPSPLQLAKWTPARLKTRCSVGYRAERIIRLARDVADGKIDLAWFEHSDRSNDELYEALVNIHGIGPYAASNLCVQLGHYDRLPIDTETHRHFREVHNVRSRSVKALNKRIEKFYHRYAPYQFLAYWFEIWRHYEKLVGDATSWSADDHGSTFTAATMRKMNQP